MSLAVSCCLVLTVLASVFVRNLVESCEDCSMFLCWLSLFGISCLVACQS
ncbi:hypothetical protein HanRHA438_Chr15g0686681 [Helianthus annuus]|nr:hypothetical protein HanRHA438_Chr15g0686681 [Helianthus annuus]